MEVMCGVLIGTALLKTLFKLLPTSQPCQKCHHLIEPKINQCPNCKVNIVWKNIKNLKLNTALIIGNYSPQSTLRTQIKITPWNIL
jgi:hypothetical protein